MFCSPIFIPLLFGLLDLTAANLIRALSPELLVHRILLFFLLNVIRLRSISYIGVCGDEVYFTSLPDSSWLLSYNCMNILGKVTKINPSSKVKIVHRVQFMNRIYIHFRITWGKKTLKFFMFQYGSIAVFSFNLFDFICLIWVEISYFERRFFDSTDSVHFV